MVWLADVPEGLVRRAKDADSRIMVVKHRPPLEAPRLPAILQGRVSVETAATAAAEPPELLDDASVVSEQTDPFAGQDVDPKALEIGSSEVRKAYESWASRWKRWAQEELAAVPHRRLHQQLYRIAKKVQQDGDSFETVLAVGLLQVGAERTSARVRRHIVTVPVTLTVDPNSVNVTVSLVPGQSGRLEDTEFLSESDGYTSELLGVVRSEVEEVAFHPLSDRASEAVRSWSQRAFGVERTLSFDSGSGHPDITVDPQARSLHHAPALILREHGQRSVLGFFESIARVLKRPGAQAPLGLAQLLYDLEPEQRTAWGSSNGPVPPALGPEPLFPMVTNAAQLDVLERLQHDTSVVVQGPPGTGKTHTISNLIAALLADGKRVLVTSEKGQALKVLIDQLPPNLRSMCVLQRDQWQGGSSDLRQSLGALAHLSATTNPERLQQRIETQQSQRHQLMAEQAKLREHLRAVREAEWYEHPEIAPGYRGRLDEIVQAAERGTADYQWLPPLPPQPGQLPPLDTEEAQRLWLLVTEHGPEILDARIQYCPDPSTLPNPEDVADRIRDIEAAKEVLGPKPVTPLGGVRNVGGEPEP
ncbi:AAA domain-containing protein [Streptomyces evansiae]|uniref:AAA domain-containing protein n=1 Tax=Streptomyces evansiae TaxID=3075535 RepID=UPI002887D09E|nr:AAA domain-containing protein [Streptomyces sp. DSM 41859]MDT0424290.1 AAA domain-containing protein [Streptomyces sp. DSM 41859]